jgi:hypothetical protein
MNTSRSRTRDITDLLVWFATAFLLLALVNGLKKVVPLQTVPEPTLVMDDRRR